MQRLCRYPLLLQVIYPFFLINKDLFSYLHYINQQLLKLTDEDHKDFEKLKISFRIISETVEYTNEKVRNADNIQKLIDIQNSISKCPVSYNLSFLQIN